MSVKRMNLVSFFTWLWKYVWGKTPWHLQWGLQGLTLWLDLSSFLWHPETSDVHTLCQIVNILDFDQLTFHLQNHFAVALTGNQFCVISIYPKTIFPWENSDWPCWTSYSGPRSPVRQSGGWARGMASVCLWRVGSWPRPAGPPVKGKYFANVMRSFIVTWPHWN